MKFVNGYFVAALAIVASMVIGVSASLAGSSGSTNHSLGRGGIHYKFDEQCHRVSFVPPGVSNGVAIEVLAQQVRCLVRRPDPFARCVHRLGPTPTVVGRADHGAGKPGDWTNVDRVAAYLAGVAGCSTAKFENG